MERQRVSLGANSKMVVLRSERTRIQTFYRDVLGCTVDVKPTADLVWLRSDFYLGIVYEDSALSKDDMLKSVWLELRTDEPDRLKDAVLEFGLTELEHEDNDHFYFQAPGGQVFRIVGTFENMELYRDHGIGGPE